MTLINRISYDGPPPDRDKEQAPWLVCRFPRENLVLGSQLIVNRNQEVVVFHDGKVLGVFGPGAHTLSFATLPLLQRFLKSPPDIRTPINAEVYFVNKAAQLDVKWGTFEPLRITDPRYQIIVRVRAYGQFSAKISDTRNFVSQVVGTFHDAHLLDCETVSGYLRRLVGTKVKNTIADMMINKKTSIVDIMASVDSVSIACREKVMGEFDRFGMNLLSFLVESISVPEEDMAEVRELQRKLIELTEALKKSSSEGDLPRAKHLCAELVLLTAKQGDYTEMLKYLPVLKDYAKEEEKAAIEDLMQRMSYRQERGIKPGKEFLEELEILAYQVKMK
jgi:hypothetical protein